MKRGWPGLCWSVSSCLRPFSSDWIPRESAAREVAHVVGHFAAGRAIKGACINELFNDSNLRQVTRGNEFMVDYEAAVRPKFLALRPSCEPVKGILDEERSHLRRVHRD